VVDEESKEPEDYQPVVLLTDESPDEGVTPGASSQKESSELSDIDLYGLRAGKEIVMEKNQVTIKDYRIARQLEEGVGSSSTDS
jgi:hypothetical protein